MSRIIPKKYHFATFLAVLIAAPLVYFVTRFVIDTFIFNLPDTYKATIPGHKWTLKAIYNIVPFTFAIITIAFFDLLLAPRMADRLKNYLTTIYGHFSGGFVLGLISGAVTHAIKDGATMVIQTSFWVALSASIISFIISWASIDDIGTTYTNNRGVVKREGYKMKGPWGYSRLSCLSSILGVALGMGMTFSYIESSGALIYFGFSLTIMLITSPVISLYKKVREERKRLKV